MEGLIFGILRYYVLAFCRYMWVEFVVGSLPCSEGFFSGYSRFPRSSKPPAQISKFQFDLERACLVCFNLLLQYVIRKQSQS